jgi:hypothetical protein
MFAPAGSERQHAVPFDASVRAEGGWVDGDAGGDLGGVAGVRDGEVVFDLLETGAERSRIAKVDAVEGLAGKPVLTWQQIAGLGRMGSADLVLGVEAVVEPDDLAVFGDAPGGPAVAAAHPVHVSGPEPAAQPCAVVTRGGAHRLFIRRAGPHRSGGPEPAAHVSETAGIPLTCASWYR